MYQKSNQKCMEDLVKDMLDEEELPSDTYAINPNDDPIRVVVCDSSFGTVLEQLASKCKQAGWTYHTLCCEKLPGNPPMLRSDNQAVLSYVEPANPLLKALKKIQKAMTDLNCGLHRGQVYIKPKESLLTYVRYKDVESFLQTLTANEALAEELIGKIHTLASILNSDECHVVRQIEIDHNLVEVLGGKVFHIQEKKFMPITSSTNGNNVSPRAFVRYDPDKHPNPSPKIFTDFLTNSFPSSEEQIEFLRKYYQCLCVDQFDHKTRKLCIVGEKDSGKTSLLAPLQGIIPLAKISTLTREKQFSAQMITKDTELVFIDEWSPQTLDSEAAKKLLQGGYFVTAVKHKVLYAH